MAQITGTAKMIVVDELDLHVPDTPPAPRTGVDGDTHGRR